MPHTPRRPTANPLCKYQQYLTRLFSNAVSCYEMGGINTSETGVGTGEVDILMKMLWAALKMLTLNFCVKTNP